MAAGWNAPSADEFASILKGKEQKAARYDTQGRPLRLFIVAEMVTDQESHIFPRVKHLDQLQGLPDERRQHDRLCELNVIEQVVNVCQTPVVRDAWKRGESLAVHGWIYGLNDGLLTHVYHFQGDGP